MNYNNSAGNYVPIKYAEEVEQVMPEQMYGWGQACPVSPESSTDTHIMTQPGFHGGPAAGEASSGISRYLEDYVFIPGFLRANIGNLLRVEFLIGCNTTERMGILREVGSEYIVLETLDGCGRVMCDIPSIRFVTILRPLTCVETIGNFMEP